MAQKAQGTGQGRNMNSGDMSQSEQLGGAQDRTDQSQQSGGGPEGGQQGSDQGRSRQAQQSAGGDASDHHASPRKEELRDINRGGTEQAGWGRSDPERGSPASQGRRLTGPSGPPGSAPGPAASGRSPG